MIKLLNLRIYSDDVFIFKGQKQNLNLSYKQKHYKNPNFTNHFPMKKQEQPASVDFTYPTDSQRKMNKYPEVNENVQETFKTYTQGSSEAKNNSYDLNMAAHPVACVCTFVFKVLAVVGYFFFGLIFSEVFVFIIVTVLSGIDFWVVKNVTGRLLVGLRWWSDFTEDGKEVWVYESHDREVKLNAVDSAFFWTSQLASTLTWMVFLLLKVLSLSFFWGLLVFINFILSATNLYGFYKCRGQHSKKLQGLKQKYAKQGLLHFASKMI